MNRHRWRYWVTSAVLVTAAVLAILSLIRLPYGAQAAAADDEDKPKPADTLRASGKEGEAIRQASIDYIEALNKGDLKAILAFWAPDADYVDESGKMTRGRDAIVALFKKSLPELKGAKFKGRLHSLKSLHRDVVLEDGSVEIISADGMQTSNRYALVWVKSGGKWLISSARDLPAEANPLPCLAYGQLKGLEWLVGHWGSQTDNTDVQLSCRWFENKSFLIVEYKVSRSGEEPMLVRQRVGWDPHNEMVRSWVYDSKGGFGEGYWERQGNRWVISQSGILPDGGVGSATHSIEFVDHDTFIWHSKDRQVDGQPMSDSEVKFIRKSAEAGEKQP